MDREEEKDEEVDDTHGGGGSSCTGKESMAECNGRFGALYGLHLTRFFCVKTCVLEARFNAIF